jgi:ABC-type uncharacterized transport system substrate-binding protein
LPPILWQKSLSGPKYPKCRQCPGPLGGSTARSSSVTQRLVPDLRRHGVSYTPAPRSWLPAPASLHQRRPYRAANAVIIDVSPSGCGSAAVASKTILSLVASATVRFTALVVQNDPLFDSRRSQIVALSSRHRLPGFFHIREFPADGGLMGYGASLADTYRQVGVYAGKILRGAKPEDLPVLRPTKFELVINMQTAKTLGLAVPQSISLRPTN